jgi:PDZ domain
MGAPRHLWSGDWQQESSARAEELASRRGTLGESPETPEPAANTQPPRQSWMQRLADWWRSGRARRRRRLRVATLVALVAVLGAGAVWAVTSAIAGGGGKKHPPAVASGSRPWLGIDGSSWPGGGVLVDRVHPGSPAQAAGIKPGDVITQIDTEPIAEPAILTAAISGLQPGDRVDIELQRGRAAKTVTVTLGSR